MKICRLSLKLDLQIHLTNWLSPMWGPKAIVVITAITIHFNFFFFLMNKKEHIYMNQKNQKNNSKTSLSAQNQRGQPTAQKNKKAITSLGWPDNKTQHQTLQQPQTTNYNSYPTSKTSTRRTQELSNPLY